MKQTFFAKSSSISFVLPASSSLIVRRGERCVGRPTFNARFLPSLISFLLFAFPAPGSLTARKSKRGEKKVGEGRGEVDDATSFGDSFFCFQSPCESRHSLSSAWSGYQGLNIWDRRVRSRSLAGMYQGPCTSRLSFSNWSFALNRRRGDAHKADRKTGRLVNTAQQGNGILLSCPRYSGSGGYELLSG